MYKKYNENGLFGDFLHKLFLKSCLNLFSMGCIKISFLLSLSKLPGILQMKLDLQLFQKSYCSRRRGKGQKSGSDYDSMNFTCDGGEMGIGWSTFLKYSLSSKIFLSPPPGLCLTLSKDPILLSALTSIFWVTIWKSEEKFLIRLNALKDLKVSRDDKPSLDTINKKKNFEEVPSKKFYFREEVRKTTHCKLLKIASAQKSAINDIF